MLTPKEFAASRKVSVDTVVRHCLSGRLPCENWATGKQRAKWRIHPDAKLADVLVFEGGPPAPPPPTRRVRRRAATAVSRHFPSA